MEMKFPKCETKMKDCKYNPPVYSGDQCMFHIADGKNCIYRQHVADYKLSNYDAQAAKIAQLEKAVELACHRTITPCPALETFGKCQDCPGFYPEGLEGENEACTRGKMAHYMQKAKEANNG
jgi:hypothetical protein